MKKYFIWITMIVGMLIICTIVGPKVEKIFCDAMVENVTIEKLESKGFTKVSFDTEHSKVFATKGHIQYVFDINTNEVVLYHDGVKLMPNKETDIYLVFEK